MSLSRRGFFGALLGGAAAALAIDPEKLLRKPGKLISIPAVRQRSLRLFGCDLDICDQDLLLDINEFGRRYLDPAVQVLANNIDSACLETFSRPRFHRLEFPPWPGAVDASENAKAIAIRGDFGKVPEARLLRYYDPGLRRGFARLEALVEI